MIFLTKRTVYKAKRVAAGTHQDL